MITVYIDSIQQLEDTRSSRVTVTSTGADFYHSEMGKEGSEWVLTVSYVYAGAGTFRGLSATQGASQPDTGFGIGDTAALQNQRYDLYSVTGGIHVPEISKIKLPNGTEYDLKDAWARQQIEAITGGDAIVFKGVSSTALTDGGTENPTVDGTVVTEKVAGDLYFYQTYEFIWDGAKWVELGLAPSEFGDLAFADTASTSYTPDGSVTFSGTTNKTATVSAADSGTTTYTPGGTVTQPTFTGTAMTSTGSFTPEGSVALSGSASTVSKATDGTATYTPEGSVESGYTNTASSKSLSVTGTCTPNGSVTLGDKAVSTVSKANSGTATYTPEGSVSAPTISVATAGSTGTIHNPTSVTVAKTVVAAAPGTTAPSNNLTYYSVSSETLSLYQLGYTTGDSITTSDVTVKTGDAAYSSTAPTFTGTGARLVTDSQIPGSASFSGSSTSVSASGTLPTISSSFSGTGARLVTDTNVPTSGSFTGTSGSVSVTGTPAGTVSQPTFSGTAVRLVTGNIEVPSSASFTGTAATITVTPDSGT